MKVMTVNDGLTPPPDYWQSIWQAVSKSPIAATTLFMTYLMGYGIAFLVFDYRKAVVNRWKGMYQVFGVCYAAFVFLVMNIAKILDQQSSISIEDLTENSPKTLVVSSALLFVVLIVVIYRRERKKGRD